MNRFWSRRIAYGAATFFVLLCVLRVVQVKSHWLDRPDHFSGYVLCAAIIFLAAFNLRKRLSFVPLGSASTWMQLHIYTALGAVIVFLAHTGMRWPNGRFETLLYMTFALTTISGMVGLFLTRVIPRRLTKLREEIIYERIPYLRRRLQVTAHAAIAELVAQQPAEALSDFYLNRLLDYFGRPRSLAYKLAPNSQLRNSLQHELGALSRYLAPDERAAQRELQELIDQRDDLDYHDAQQGRLRTWLFAHLALTAVLVVLMFVHVVMAHAFSGS